MNRMFRRIDGIVWDAITGQTGLKTSDGVYTYTPGAEGEAGSVGVNLIDVSVALPGFATATPFEQVKIGDIIVGDSKIIGWVDEKLVNSFRVKDHSGFTKIYSPPKVSMMGIEGALVVRNLFSLTGGADGLNSMLPMLMMAGDDSKIEKMLPFLLMQQGQAGGQNSGGAAPAMNPMLMMMLMKDGGFGGKKGGGIDPMMLMMMGGMGGGAGGMNPMAMMAMMGGLGNDEPTPLPAPVQRGLPPLSSIQNF